MIEEILNYIHNYFIKESHVGDFTVQDGRLNVDFLQEGQYFKIVGSIFNDGVHKNGDNDLTDEVFSGEVQSLAIPVSLVNLSKEIEQWCEDNKEAINSPYQSESFGGYSYSKAMSSSKGSVSWQSIFGSKLNHWRKLS